MRKFEKILKIISLVIGTAVFSFLAWLMLIYPNFEESTSFIIAGVMAVAILFGIYRWGYWFFRD